jgi:hypothetical protein
MRYEMITVPIMGYVRSSTPLKGELFLLLRNRRLELQPNLELSAEGGDFLVKVQHRSHFQLVDLMIELSDERGRTWYARPNGEIVLNAPVKARTGILLSSGTRATDLYRHSIPPSLDGARVVGIRALLLNPNSLSGDPFAAVSPEAKLELH